MTPLDPILYDDFSGGVLRGVSPYKMPPEGTPHALNFVFDEVVGEAKLRKGTGLVGTQIVNANPVLGLSNFRSRATSNHAILAVISDGVNNDIYKGEAWAKSLADDTKDLKTRFAQFLDSIVRVNGTDARKSFNGTSWITTGGVFSLGDMPNGNYVLNYKDRVHIIGEDGILYSSSVPRFFLDYDGQTAQFTEGTVLTGQNSNVKATILKDTNSDPTGTLELTGLSDSAFQDNETIIDTGGGSAVANGAGGYRVSWTENYITTPIDPDNGEKGKCTGVGKTGGLMLIFFERAMYSWNGKSTEADELVGVGCSSQESVAIDKESGILFFANEHGVYITKGGYPQKISKFVQDYFDNMSSANYQHIAGGCDGKHYFCSIGNVTINNKTINNVVLRYTIASQEWAVLSYPTQPRVFSQYISGTDVKLLYGDNDGNVIEIDSSDTDDNTGDNSNIPIDYEFDFQDIFQPLMGGHKSIKNRIILDTQNSSGAKLLVRKDSVNEKDFKVIGEVKENIQEFKTSVSKFKYARFRIAERSLKGRLSIRALEIPFIDFLNY